VVKGDEQKLSTDETVLFEWVRYLNSFFSMNQIFKLFQTNMFPNINKKGVEHRVFVAK